MNFEEVESTDSGFYPHEPGVLGFLEIWDAERGDHERIFRPTEDQIRELCKEYDLDHDYVLKTIREFPKNVTGVYLKAEVIRIHQPQKDGE